MGRIRLPTAARLLLAALLLAAFPAGAAPAPLVIGAEDDWYPYAAVRDGRLQGLAVDLVSAAFAAAGHPVTLRPLPYARCMAMVDSGALAGCFNTSRDRSLDPHYAWHAQPLFRARILIFSPAAAATPTGVAGLAGRRVALTNGYTYGDEVDLDPGIRRQWVSGDLAALRMLAAGRVDHALVFEAVAADLIRNHPGELAGRIRATGLVREMDLYLSFSLKHPDAAAARAALDRGLALIARDGTRARIDRAWRDRTAAASLSPVN